MHGYFSVPVYPLHPTVYYTTMCIVLYSYIQYVCVNVHLNLSLVISMGQCSADATARYKHKHDARVKVRAETMLAFVWLPAALLLRMASMGQCSADATDPVVGFPPIRWSGECTDIDGGTWIEDKKTCDLARMALAPSAPDVSPAYSNDRIRGCSMTRGGSMVIFNRNNESQLVCGYDDKYACLCAAVAPACDPQDGSNPHAASPSCVCGPAARLCTSNTGMVCNATSSTCKQTATLCADTSGATKPELGQEAVCKCGSVDCTSGTGFFCNAHRSLCRSYAVPTCAGLNGTVAQPEDVPNCACGHRTECSAGEYCFASINECSTNGKDFVGFPPLRSSGKCTDLEGGKWITDRATCEQARTALGLSDTDFKVGSITNALRGCTFDPDPGDYFVRFNSNETGGIQLQPGAKSQPVARNTSIIIRNDETDKVTKVTYCDSWTQPLQYCIVQHIFIHIFHFFT